MEETEEGTEQTSPEEVSPSAVSKKLQEARREETLTRLFGSSKVFLTFGETSSEPRPDLQASVLIQTKAQEHCRKGKEAVEKCEYARAVTCFSKAINLQPHQADLYVLQAEAYLQLCDFQSAALSYTRACVLQPDVHTHRLAFVYYLQGQCLFDRCLFQDALESFGKASELRPGFRAYDARRVACLSALGHFSDCLNFVTEWMQQDGPTADLYVLRARLHKQLNKTPQCFQDVKCALELNPSCPEGGALLQQLKETAERARKAAVDRALCGDLHQALKLTDVALENLPQEPQLYVFRGTLYRRLKEFSAATQDLMQAVELSEREGGEEPNAVVNEARVQMVLVYNDFSLDCFSRGLYDEATELLNKAIEEEKNQPGLYINRGDCFFKQKIWVYALADYEQAEELLGPNDPTIQQRLSVLHKAVGNVCFSEGRFKDAVSSFSQALKYDPTLGEVYEARSKAHRKLGSVEQAKEDFIRTLILQPHNTELPAMLMSLFPGFSLSNVLSTATAQSVREQLEQEIQAHSNGSSSSSQRLRSVSSQQLRSVSSQQLRSVSSHQLRSVSSQQLRSVSSQQLRSVSSHQLRSVSSQQLMSVFSQQLSEKPQTQGSSVWSDEEKQLLSVNPPHH
ncbi:hypothetical protein WMY93_004931 [Mugilogobius chulae]|uniref:Tetratricopeptide repeat domain 16 n=1 Tax=Mugilogobius chulae TaxID=88201 RepID=A0AAW0PVW0_9GOBI